MSKLIEVLNELDKEQDIKIGSKDGSSLWYCGNVTHFLVNAYNSNVRLLDYARARVKSANERYERVLQTPVSEMDFVIAETKRATKEGVEPILNANAYFDWKSKWWKKVSSAYKVLKTYKKQLEKFVPLLDREVISVVDADKTIEDNCKVIIVEGYESGKYWKMSEAIVRNEPIGLSMGEDTDE